MYKLNETQKSIYIILSIILYLITIAIIGIYGLIWLIEGLLFMFTHMLSTHHTIYFKHLLYFTQDHRFAFGVWTIVQGLLALTISYGLYRKYIWGFILGIAFGVYEIFTAILFLPMGVWSFIFGIFIVSTLSIFRWTDQVPVMSKKTHITSMLVAGFLSVYAVVSFIPTLIVVFTYNTSIAAQQIFSGSYYPLQETVGQHPWVIFLWELFYLLFLLLTAVGLVMRFQWSVVLAYIIGVYELFITYFLLPDGWHHFIFGLCILIALIIPRFHTKLPLA